jgi:predicted HTH transcriptional regulator
MTLAGKQLDSLNVDDLQALIDAGVSEGREIEFKVAVGSADKDKREFLADVSSFANASGGDLLIGVAAKGGIATELTGFPKLRRMRRSSVWRT